MILLSVFLFSCKNNNSTVSEKSSTETSMAVPDHYAMMNQEDFTILEVTGMRQSAIALLNHRKTAQNNKSYTILDKDIWLYEATVKNSDFITGEKVAGRWIDFRENLTYAYGIYQDQKGTGQYFFDFENKKMLMIDDHPAIKPQEFDVKLSNDMLVLVGEAVYSDNNLQAKLIRIPTIPVK